MSENSSAASSVTLDLPSEDASLHFARKLSRLLKPGDAVLLSGPVGAGKTHLARSFIQSRLGQSEDVPSPTFTLVQTYGPPEAEIWHADLYRLSHPDEVWELGLDDAFQTAICLVEWPDRLGRHQPGDALHINLSVSGDGRMAIITGGRPGLLVDIETSLRDV